MDRPALHAEYVMYVLLWEVMDRSLLRVDYLYFGERPKCKKLHVIDLYVA